MAKVYKDLREFLKTLEEEGQLIRVKDEVDPEPDIGAAGRACANMDKKPAVLFEKVKGYKYSVVTNVHGSWANHALMMGMPKDTPVKEQFHELNRRWDKFPVPPVILPREKAMCKENTISENINLFDVFTESMIRTVVSSCLKQPLLPAIRLNLIIWISRMSVFTVSRSKISTVSASRLCLFMISPSSLLRQKKSTSLYR